MAEPISVQQLKNASEDANSLGEAVNGDENSVVTTRLGETYPTLSNALNQIDSKLDSADAQIKQGITNLFENGGLPATPFNSRAEMALSSLINGSYAAVVNDKDSVNNGIYLKKDGTWVKTAYSTSYEKIKNDLYESIPVISSKQPVYEVSSGYWTSISGVATKGDRHEDYSYSSPILVKSGEMLQVEAIGEIFCPLVEVTAEGEPLQHLGFKNAASRYIVTTLESTQDKYYSVSGKSFDVYYIDGYKEVVKPSAIESAMPSYDIILDKAKSTYAISSTRVITDSSKRTYRLPVKRGDVVKMNDSSSWAFIYLNYRQAMADFSGIRPASPYFRKYTNDSYTVEFYGVLDVCLNKSSSFSLNGIDIRRLDIATVYDNQWYLQALLEGTTSNPISTTSNPVRVNKGDIVYIEQPAAGTVSILYKDSSVGSEFIAAATTEYIQGDIAFDPISWVAPESTEVLICAKTSSNVKVYKNIDYVTATASGVQVLDRMDAMLPYIDNPDSMSYTNGFYKWNEPSFRQSTFLDTLYFNVSKGQTVTLEDTYDLSRTMLYFGESSELAIDVNKYWLEGISEEGYAAPYDGIVIVVTPSNSIVLIDGVEATASQVMEGQEYYQKGKPVASSEIVISERPVFLAKGDSILIEDVKNGTGTILDVTDGKNQYALVIGRYLGKTEYMPVEYTAPRDMYIKYSMVAGSGVSIKRKSVAVISSGSSKAANIDPDIPDVIKFPLMEYVFATAMNYILKLETREDGIEYIAMSTDLGKTWNYTENILGDIMHYHFFSDGTVILCSNTKTYYTSDYKTLTESTVIDHDGTPFVPTHRHFFSHQNSDKIMIKDGKELVAWGEYVLNTPCRIWYSTDYGRTIKCATLFGTTPMVDGNPINTKHVHRMNYRTKDGKFYITTGDVGNECMVIKADYSFETDEWSWEVLASGDEFKFGAIYFDDVFAYLATDYTTVALRDKKGIYRTPVHKIGDYSSYQAVYRADPAEWGSIALSRLIVDRINGYTVILPDYKGTGYFWFSKNGFDFKRISISPNKFIGYAIGANYNGDVYCVVYNNSSELTTPTELKLSRGVFNLTKAIRDAGFYDFMRFNPMAMDSGSVTEQP